MNVHPWHEEVAKVVDCSYCHQKKGHYCVIMRGSMPTSRYAHAERINAYHKLEHVK